MRIFHVSQFFKSRNNPLPDLCNILNGFKILLSHLDSNSKLNNFIDIVDQLLESSGV